MSIVLQGLVKRFGVITVVDHVSLEIEDGELFVLLGPSGSGKSTILRMIAGLTPADEGRILLHGRDVTDLPPQQRQVGFVFQNYSLFRHMSVADNIEFGLAVRKVPKAERAVRRDELLELIGLAGMGDRSPRQLSGGQQQRVAVARALAFEPSVLLLDEPFGALDARIRAQLRQTLKAIQRRLGVTTILVTHDQEEAFELGDRIGVIERGRLLESGPPAELYRRPRHEFVARFLGSANLLAAGYDGERIRIGPLTLPGGRPNGHGGPAPFLPPDDGGRAAALFRPEDLELAAERHELDGPVLGRGTIEEVVFLGTIQRVRVRLQPLPGTWPLSTGFGEAGLSLEVAQLSRADGTGYEPGQAVWVGIKRFHLLARAALRLLLCFDERSEAGHAVDLAATLAEATSGPLTVLAVGASPERANRLEAAARERLGHRFPGLGVKSCVGESSEATLREIGPGDYDLVIAGGAATGLLAHAAPVPVLAVKGARRAIRRILLCTAGGEPGKLDVRFGGRLARRLGAETTLLYVDAQPPPERPAHGGSIAVGLPRTRGWIERHLAGGVQTLLNQGVHAEVKVRYGPALDEICSEAAEGDYDLIVVGSHLPDSARRFVRHDLATEIVALADRPVLVVHGPFETSS